MRLETTLPHAMAAPFLAALLATFSNPLCTIFGSNIFRTLGRSA